MYTVGKIDPEHFKNVSPILTDDVIITERQIAHIMERHPQDYERFAGYIPQVLKQPDFILEANKPHRAVLLKKIVKSGNNFQLIIRIKVATDPAEYQNSVITYMKISDSRYKNYLRNKKILYKSENSGYTESVKKG